jgi:hypothetical protein
MYNKLRFTCAAHEHLLYNFLTVFFMFQWHQYPSYIQNLFVRALETDRKVSTNKCSIFQQCTYILFILQYKKPKIV